MRIFLFQGPESCSNLPFVPFLDYILGLADLTGELMRQCVSSIGSGNVANVSKCCLFLQQVSLKRKLKNVAAVNHVVLSEPSRKKSTPII